MFQAWCELNKHPGCILGMHKPMRFLLNHPGPCCFYPFKGFIEIGADKCQDVHPFSGRCEPLRNRRPDSSAGSDQFDHPVSKQKAGCIKCSQGMPAAVLYGFGFLVSFCCGFQFPLALMISGDSKIAATEYFSVDLVGAAFGVLLVSLVLIPLFGLWWATLCLAGIKLVSFLMAGTIRETA